MVFVPGRDDPKEALAKLCGELLTHEKRWRDKHSFLVSKGYTLRPRLRPGWVPSWTTSNISVSVAEDGWLSIVGNISNIPRIIQNDVLSVPWVAY